MEIRGVWITTTSSQVLNSKQNIAEAMDFLAQTGFNVVFPVVWRNGATHYPSQVMREIFGVEIDPKFQGRDPLAELIDEARRVGIAVIPWFEYGFASSYNQNGGLLLAKKPEWAARDSAGNLLKKSGFDWMNALDSEVQDFMLNLLLEVVKNYDVTGIQGDDRLPALPTEGGYDTKTVQRYQQQFNQNPPQNFKDPQWVQWRADILTNFLTRLYQEVIAINPNLVVSMAPSNYPWGLNEYLQDSKAWIDRGLVDMIHPQLYVRDLESYKRLVDRVVNEQFTAKQIPQLAPGVLMKVSSYRISPDDLLQAIAYNRYNGIPGEVFFFYEGLREDNDALANVLRSGAYSQSASQFNPQEVKKYGFTTRRLSGNYIYIDKTNQPIIQPKFDWVYPFCEERARVRMGYLWGYIDKTGNLVTRLEYDMAEHFAEGMAMVVKGNKSGYIDNTGKIVIPLQFERADSFSEGLARVKVAGLWGYINNTGKVIIQSQFPQAASFSEGLARVVVLGKWGYIDKTGKLIIQPQFYVAKSFSEGLVAVKIGDKWGYIDKAGKVVIKPQFSDVDSFTEGLAAVKIGEKWGYIDKAGNLVVEPKFDAAKPFAEGVALINIGGEWLQSINQGNLYFSGGKWGYIRNILA